MKNGTKLMKPEENPALEKKNITCITCPLGCKLDIVLDKRTGDIISNKGWQCKKGIKFAEEEIKNPVRLLTTTISICSEKNSRLPVRSLSAVPKDMLESLVNEVKKIKISAPVLRGQVLAENLLGCKVKIISSATVEK